MRQLAQILEIQFLQTFRLEINQETVLVLELRQLKLFSLGLQVSILGYFH